MFKWITWYNTKRLHSSLDHTSPTTWEQQYRQTS
ncbi:IS3 family transposase [Gemmatimonas sp.]